ncbi:MAG: polysaccharide deacetylase family protein [bacterium]|nr:polysaccharide deacetylase family protein [bacterium]
MCSARNTTSGSPQRLRRTIAGAVAPLLEHAGYLARKARRSAGLRVLTYHGVCSDEVAGEPWLPPHFVTQSAFEQQLRILRSAGNVVHLPAVIDGLLEGKVLDEPCFAITFDDGHACTLRHALPGLEHWDLRATFFVATGHVDEGRWFLSDRLRVLGALPEAIRADLPKPLRVLVASPTLYKTHEHDHVLALVEESWPALQDALPDSVVECFAPLGWPDLSRLAAAGHEIGAHTVGHVILARETRARREAELAESVRRVRAQVGCGDAFAYPNGVPGDFDAQDAEILRREGVRYAFTTVPGRCLPPVDPFALPRTSIGLGHDEHTFALEMSGLLDSRRRRQHARTWAT